MVTIVRRYIIFSSLILCFIAFITLPIFIQAQIISENQDLDANILEDTYERPLYFFKKGQFAQDYDVHSYRMSMKEDKIYVAKLWITAEDGGIYYLRLKGEHTEMEVHIETSEELDNRLLEVKYTADENTAGRIIFTYYTAISEQIPTYTLYANRAGFAGVWWIILAGISILTVFVVMFSFMIIGIKSTTKKRGKKRKK